MKHFVLTPPPEKKWKGLPKGWTMYREIGNVYYPAIYFRRPKNFPEREFAKLMTDIANRLKGRS
jgi:hypothetical protein